MSHQGWLFERWQRGLPVRAPSPRCWKGDVRDRALLDEGCSPNHKISGAIHFAALKAVGESVSQPLE